MAQWQNFSYILEQRLDDSYGTVAEFFLYTGPKFWPADFRRPQKWALSTIIHADLKNCKCFYKILHFLQIVTYLTFCYNLLRCYNDM